MSTQINILPNALTLFQGIKSKGPVLFSHEFDAELNTNIEVMEFEVSNKSRVPSDLPDTIVAEIRNTAAINTARLRASVVPVAVMEAYKLETLTRVGVDLPRVLKSVKVVWSQQQSIGTQDTQAYDYASGLSGAVSLSIPDSASSAASVSADIQVELEELDSSGLLATRLEFYLKPPLTTAGILAKLAALLGASVAAWPTFKTKSSTITVTGQSVSVRANVNVMLKHSWSPTGNARGAASSVSDDFSVNLQTNSVQIPHSIHNGITIEGDLTKSIPIAATAFMYITSSNGAAITATKTKTGIASGVVTPATLPATGGPAIPTSGLYLLNLEAPQVNRFGWYKLSAVIFDAATLA